MRKYILPNRTETITKYYPNKIEYIALKHAIMSESDKPKPTKMEKRTGMTPEQIAKLDEENLERSVRRSQKQLADIIECNDFDWFGTFTFDPKKIDRHDQNAVKAAMTQWLNIQRRKSPDMLYILVPERHKDGAIHFHALMGNYNGKMAQSGSKWQNQPIYNVIDYKLGFTNFTKIRNKAKAANYCRKYITKDMAKITNNKRYWASLNLKKPTKRYNEEMTEVWRKNANIDPLNISVYENDHLIATKLPLTKENPQTEND